MSRAANLGSIDGNRHGLISKMDGARSAFIKRPELAESEWREYSAAYDIAYRGARRFMGGAL